MKRITLFSYKLNNIEDVFDEIANETFFLTNADVLNRIGNADRYVDVFQKYKYYDISLMMSGDYERVDTWIGTILYFVQCFIDYRQEKKNDMQIIVDKRYANNIYTNLPYFFSNVESLEMLLGIDKKKITNVVDLDSNSFLQLQDSFNTKLFGNGKFKKRLFEELSKFRRFNYIGERKIFSAFLSGPSGIGKTETAWILHEVLAPGEKHIKINLGNYSESNALSSLIGSPRGYIGSSKGELSDKIESSKSTIILIDEFEKASKEIHNFFLELLSDGSFTDSLGREFDLDKYIVLFTSNLSKDNIGSVIAPELWSRFDLKYEMSLLTADEKRSYIDYKLGYYATKVRLAYELGDDFDFAFQTGDIDVDEYDNMRRLNRELETIVSNRLDELNLTKPNKPTSKKGNTK